MTFETIDIEALLIRAYHEKAVHLFGRPDDRQARILGKLIALHAPSTGGGGGVVSERVQTSCYISNRTARERVLMAQVDFGGDSLLALHDAVLGLPLFYFERLGGLDFQVWDHATAEAMGHRITVEGQAVRIERVRKRGGSDPKRAGELRAAGPARRLVAIEPSTLIISHGKAADRPFVPDLVEEGRRPVYHGADKRAAGYEPVYETPLADVVEARALYATWRACLGMLAASCAGFRDLDVTGPAAPAAPWDEAPAAGFGQAPRARRPGRKTEKYHSPAMA